MLHDQLPWYVGGPVLGLCVIALRLLLNGRLGVTGGYTDAIDNVSDSAGERADGEHVDALGSGRRGRDAAPRAQAA